MKWNNATYHFTRVNGVGNVHADLAAKFGKQGAIDPKTKSWICVDNRRNENIFDKHPNMRKFLPPSGTYPVYMYTYCDDPSNCTHEEAFNLTQDPEWTGIPA